MCQVRVIGLDVCLTPAVGHQADDELHRQAGAAHHRLSRQDGGVEDNPVLRLGHNVLHLVDQRVLEIYVPPSAEESRMIGRHGSGPPGSTHVRQDGSRP